MPTYPPAIWKPVYDPLRVRPVIDGIYKTLQQEFGRYSNTTGLMNGTPGVILFLYYYYQLTDSEESVLLAGLLLERLFENVNQRKTQLSSLAGGLAGIGWLIEHLSQEEFLEIDTEELLSAVDAPLQEVMLKEAKKGNHDYLYGSMGIALYLLERKTIRHSASGFQSLIRTLGQLGQQESGTWRWPDYDHEQEVSREGIYNFGTAHGMPAMSLVLLMMEIKSPETEAVRPLMEGAVRFLLTQKTDPEDQGSCFPYLLKGMGKDRKHSGLGWCCGDLGVANAIWHAGKYLDKTEWVDEALSILLHSTTRKDLALNEVTDAGLCRGTAGIAHIFNRFYHATERDDFREAAIYWYEKTLQLPPFENGLPDFRPRKGAGWAKDCGLLEGIAGIGLSLISAISTAPPRWDRCLLLS